MDAVHGVVPNDLRHALHHIVGGLRDGRVQVDPIARSADPVRMGADQIVRGDGPRQEAELFSR